MSRSKDYCKSCRKTHQKSYRKDCGKSCRKVQPEKTDAAVKLQPPGHQGPAEKLQEGPRNGAGHMKGPGDGGAPWPRRDRQNTGKGRGTEEQHSPGERQEGPVRRILPEDPAKELPEGPQKSCRKVQRAITPNKAALLDLLSELLEEIILKVTSLKDVIALGSSCRRMAAIVGQASLWRRVFSKIQLVERGGVERVG